VTARLGLGTAQFGADYGIANRRGRVPRAEVQAVLAAAHAAGVALLDTAPAYGCAEQVLGALREHSAPFAVVTKTAVGGDTDGVRPTLLASLRHLQRRQVDVLLLHDRRALLGADGDAWFGALCRVRDEGLAARIGVSVYAPDEAFAIAARYPVQVVQLPLNVFDQRARSSGLLARLAASAVEVHARSPFLQGLLLLEPDALPAGLGAARGPLAAFRARAADLGLTPVAAALGFALATADVGTVLCGVDGRAQLDEVLAARRAAVRTVDFADLAVDDPDLVDPSRWQVAR
jgi:aryl-alcohol dehydrogenase-like predicted oxidoreductase